jgi:hypothetical protein
MHPSPPLLGFSSNQNLNASLLLERPPADQSSICAKKRLKIERNGYKALGVRE